MGIGEASGENRATTAARMAASSPLLEISIEGAKGVLFNITGGPDMTMTEVSDASNIISSAADPDANIIFGATIDEDMGANMKISVIATGFASRGFSVANRPQFGAYSKDSKQKQEEDSTPTLKEPSPQEEFHPSTEPQVSINQPLTKTSLDSTKEADVPEKKSGLSKVFSDDFEIPAFLRNKGK
jgi:cell division protein FtsZ